MLDKLRSRIVHLGPSLLSVPVKLTPFALKRQVLEQVLSWQFRQALDDGKLLAAVNQTLVSFDHPLTDGDEVAFFPPVTGG